MHVRYARYTVTSGSVQELARQAEDGLLPIFQSQPGFKSYSVADIDGEVMSLSVWESAESADAANRAAASWVADNMAGSIELQESRIGEILFSTIFGVSTLAGTRA